MNLTDSDKPQTAPAADPYPHWTDRQFLCWIHDRLEHVYGEDPLIDYMHKLRCIIHATPAEAHTVNIGQGMNSLDELKDSWRIAKEEAN